MKDVGITSQIFSLLTVATMMSSAFFLYIQDSEDLYGDNRVPVWARGELPYDTSQAVMYLNKDNMDY